MRYAISGCFDNGEVVGIWHDDEKGLYIMADGSKGGKRGFLATEAVLEAFKPLEELSESISAEDFKSAIDEGVLRAQKLIERNVREYVRSGKLDGVVQEKLHKMHGQETFSEGETQRLKAVAMEEVVGEELQHLGSTVLVALIAADTLFVANVAGDSRLEVVKMSDGGGVELETITLDHNFLWLRMHGKLPPGTLDKEKAFTLQRKLDHAKTEAELEHNEILKEAWKMKDMKGQELSVHTSPEIDFYEIELKNIVSFQLYTHGVMEHTARAQRKQELIDAEQIGIPPMTIAKTIVGLSDQCDKCSLGMIYVRKVSTE